MTSTLVSFIIPVRNDAARLDGCLRSIEANRYPRERWEVIVVDNGSTDASASVARGHGATVLSLPALRLGALRNSGVAASHGEVLAFVDADHEIAPEWISSAVDVLAAEGIGAVGAAYLPPHPGTWVQRLYGRLRRQPAGRQTVDWLGSGNLALRRSAFESVGGFDVSLETCEDVDLCTRLRARGYTIVADRRLGSVHHGDPRTLRHVFFGELWRGRDNIRVSLRAPRSWRNLISAAIPAVNLLAWVLALGGFLSGTRTGAGIGLAAITVTVALICARAIRMLAGEGSVRDIPGAVAVASAYEFGRALALVGAADHGARRKASS